MNYIKSLIEKSNSDLLFDELSKINLIEKNFIRELKLNKMKNNSKLRSWLDDLNLEHPLVIAGPCSAETESQVLQIAQDLKNSDVSIFRAGIWKPRTRPGNFEGVGSIGLSGFRGEKGNGTLNYNRGCQC